ncbi:hypothetical protein [Actinotalea sp. JY-7876]|uniref:hypothetical protein n=1 Tax=Actinotalea sp. JY-7876 TaxID=2758442 RepID=UPI0015F5A34F|nr:hypothetical protein [Actinotalea sp. JY-7876]
MSADGTLTDVEPPRRTGDAEPARDPSVLTPQARAAAIRAQAARAQAEREEAARASAERAQAQRVAQRAEQERAEQVRADQERAERERAQQGRATHERAAQQRLLHERAAQERLARERAASRSQASPATNGATGPRPAGAGGTDGDGTDGAPRGVASGRLVGVPGPRQDTALPAHRPDPDEEPEAPLARPWTGGTAWRPAEARPAPGARPATARSAAPPVAGGPRAADDPTTQLPVATDPPSAGVAPTGRPLRAGQTFGSKALPVPTTPVTDVDGAAPLAPSWSNVAPTPTGWTPTPLATGAVAERPRPAELPEDAASAVAEAPDHEDATPEPPRAHPYTWLHMIVLVAVAFVLGMLIFMVGMRESAPTDGAEPAPAAATSSPADRAGTTETTGHL